MRNRKSILHPQNIWKDLEIIRSGWRAVNFSDALKLGSNGLPSIDPFHDIVPLLWRMGPQVDEDAYCGGSTKKASLLLRRRYVP